MVCGDTVAVQASRLLSILMLLQSRGRLSAAVLAESLQVSVRTILRDVDQLSAAGVPIWAQTGRGGGICLRQGWRTQLTGLTAPEARSVVLAGLPGPAADLGLGEALALAQLKLLAALPDEARADAQHIARAFHLDASDWYRDATPPTHLQTVAGAVWSRLRLRMHYESWQRISEPTVEPLGLVLKAGQWYVAARPLGRADVRVYRLAAIEEPRVLQQGFTPPPRFDLAAWWRASAARFEAGLYTGSATLRVTEEGFTRLCRISPRVAKAAHDSAEPCEVEGVVQVHVPIESVAHAARELLRLGEHVQVLKPAMLRKALLATARQMVLAHKG